MVSAKGRTVALFLLGTALSLSSTILSAQDFDYDDKRFSSVGLTTGYNTFSPSGNTRFVNYASHFTGNSGWVVGVRFLWSPNILRHILSVGAEYQGLVVAKSDSSLLYYADSGEAVTETDYASLWQLLVGVMLVNSEKFLLQTQFGYGSWKSGSDFSESAASIRLVAAFPVLEDFITLDPELAYYKGLGAYKNSAFSIQLGISFRW